MADVIKCTLQIHNVRRYKNDWCLANGVVSACKTKELKVGEDIRIKGVLPQIQDGNFYDVMVEEDNDEKWGLQYVVKSIFAAITFDKNDNDGKKRFLSSIFTPLQIKNLYEYLPDPYETFLANDVESLVKVKGVAFKTAGAWIKRFNNNFGKAKIFSELNDYNLTNAMIDKLMDRYHSPELVIEKVKTNPYILCNEVRGIGWKTADKIALEGGMPLYDEKRVSAYIQYYLLGVGENGYSWVTPDELLGALLEELGDDLPDEPISKSLGQLIEDEIIWHNDDKTKLGLMKFFNIENKVAQELIRIRDAESNITYSNFEDTILHLEHRQGWSFTEEQKQGVKTALDNNVTLINGLAGTGKSTVVSAMIEVLRSYSFVQCSLSGRAASRMSEITGEEGFTIHRLLEYPKGDPKKGKFLYNDENPLSYDIYILDEISMVDAELFYCLLRAIPNGAKLICLGDCGQLESIGSGNIAHDMIDSPEIPTVTLTKIHRQAEKSAIITDSIAVRSGKQIVEKEWAGTITHGELQDLTITGYSDASNTYYEIMKSFSNAMNSDGFDIMDTQIIVPMKSRGQACTMEINQSVQALYNPPSSKKREEVLFSNGKNYIIREGDKVINMVNNYNTNPPVYNGNIGILKKWGYDADEDEEFLVIDFIGIGEVKIPKKFWGNIELAYAITGHKYQGSQSSHIIIGIDFSAYALLTREWVYTAITRAKEKCELIAQTSALRFAISKEGTSRKQTHLIDCLNNIAHPKLVF